VAVAGVSVTVAAVAVVVLFVNHFIQELLEFNREV